jgi:hypothetical protein
VLAVAGWSGRAIVDGVVLAGAIEVVGAMAAGAAATSSRGDARWLSSSVGPDASATTPAARAAAPANAPATATGRPRPWASAPKPVVKRMIFRLPEPTPPARSRWT